MNTKVTESNSVWLRNLFSCARLPSFLAVLRTNVDNFLFFIFSSGSVVVRFIFEGILDEKMAESRGKGLFT